MSRWGPKSSSRASRSNSPMPPGRPLTPNIPFADEPDFELVESIEWGADDASPLEELAAKPKPDRSDDPCGCTRSADPDVMTCNDLSCVLFACQEECRSNCLAGEQCANKRIQRKQWKELEVFDAGKKGKGLKVLEGVKKGDFVVEYVGRAVNKSFLPSLFRRYQNERKLYIMALDSNIYLDARRKGGIARYINHSCEPNCVVERWKVRGNLRAAVIASKDIPAGTELSFDYQWERKRGRAPTKCHCHSPTCRGTLEVPRSMQEAALERKLSTHWKKPLITRPRKEIANRCIKVFSKDTQEYFLADVVSYDETTGKHLIMYRHDLEEVWEDLKVEDWMILDEEGEQHYTIQKKTISTDSSRSLLNSQGMNSQSLSSNTPNLLLQGQKTKNYVYVQTPMHTEMKRKRLIARCEASCRVTISSQEFARPPLPVDPDDPDEVDKYNALDQSLDGVVWKLTIVGFDVAKAFNILEKNKAYLEKALAGGGGEGTAPAGINTTLGVSSAEALTEAVIPRLIVEAVKRRLPAMRDKCKSVTFTFAPSESKSKQFAKIIIEGNLQSDIESAKDLLWKQLINSCEEMNTPKTPSGVYADLGLLGGELSSSDFRRLLDDTKASNGDAHAGSSQLRHTAKEDLTKWSPFFASFEATQRCSIWVQSDADKGRIDASNRVVNEATPNAPRKIFFGCDPKLIPNLWGLIKQRATDVARGVKYLHLGADRLYQPMMMRNGGKFFEFVRQVTGAAVTVDSMTGDHLRIDGKESSVNGQHVSEVPPNISEAERAALAEELVRLQIELYRDHSIRQQSWIFGRDWTLARRSIIQGQDDQAGIAGRSATAMASRYLNVDAKSVSNACIEMADIVSNLGLNGIIAAHAAVILYRFVTVLSQTETQPSQLKMREVELASIFIANKAQKVVKWKKLDVVLEAAYKSFYPGVDFDSSKEEVLVWEDKTIAAEAEILSTLKDDIFWRGFDWIMIAAKDAAKFDSKLARETLTFATSGPVLAAGADLWLNYGAEYIFAAAGGFFDLNIEKLFPALSLIPFKVHQAAEIIFSAMKNTSFGKVQSSHPLFTEGKKGLAKRLPRIKEICAVGMKSFVPGYRLDQLSENEQRYRLLGQQNQRKKIFQGIENALVEEMILPSLDGIGAESGCSIVLENKESEGKQNMILEGSWRAIAIASYLLQETVQSKCELKAVGGTPAVTSQNSIQAKGQPGLLHMTEIETADGWADTIQSQLSSQAFWGRKTGGKSCVPGKIKESDLRKGSLRWWIPPRYGPSPTGSICDMFLVNKSTSGAVEALASLTHAFQGESAAFSMLTSMMKNQGTQKAVDRFVAVSLQRWPTEKVAKREQHNEKKDEKLKSSKGKRVWQVGFSPGALQEMQMLLRMHRLVKSPRGHPNFLLPIGIALPAETETAEPMDFSPTASKTFDLKKLDEDIFSLTRTSQENEVAAERERKRKDMVAGPHLVFHPTPFVLQRFTVRKKKRDSAPEDQSISPSIFAAWVHDLLSVMVHCHANDIVLRNFVSDQIMVDHSGVAKFGSFYRATILSAEDKRIDIVKAARDRKKEMRKSRRDDDDDILSNPYAPPEMLLGSPKYTKETDIWTMGCLLCHLLLGKPAYTGKDRQSMLLGAYKLVGRPATDNFKEGTKFPYYEKPKKRYEHGVAKALTHMMKEDAAKHAGAIDLISQMLQLDPKKRTTAKQALQHEYMQTYVENSSSSQAFQDSFVTDWITLKKKLMKASKTEEDEANERERGIKRKAMLLAASKTMGEGGDDDLYNMDDILGDGGQASKMPKIN